MKPYRHRDYSPDDLTRTIEHCKEPYNYLMEFLYLSGCRISEAGGLKWKDIDYKNKIVMIERSAEYNNNKRFVGLNPWPKNRERKIIHLTTSLTKIFSYLRQLNINDCEFIFQINGRPLNYGTLLTSIRRAQIKSGIQARGTHICRIGGSKTIRREFGNLDSVIAYTGHRDPKMADHYSKLNHDDTKKVHSRMSESITESKQRNIKNPKIDNLISINRAQK